MPSPEHWTRRWRWRIAAIAAVLVMAGGVTLHRLRGPLVPVVGVTRADILQTVVATGRVLTPQRTSIGAQVTGTVASVAVAEGQTVRAGDLLLTLDDREAQAATAQARASVHQAEARLRQLRDVAAPSAEQSVRQADANLLQARRSLERTRELNARGFLSQAALDDAQRNVDVADAQLRSARIQVDTNRTQGAEWQIANTALEQARASLRLADARVAFHAVRAPASGVLIARAVEPGDVVQPGKALMTLAPAGQTQISIQVDEKNLALIAIGQDATASADAYPATRFAAKLIYINPGVDAQRASVEAKLAVDDPPPFLRQDMTVSVDIAVARKAGALTLSADGVRDAATGKPWVLAVRDGTAVRIPVRLGIRGDNRVEIADGLAAGDAVIPATAPAVTPGQRVRTAAPDPGTGSAASAGPRT